MNVESETTISEELRKISFRIKVLRQERRIHQTELAQAVGILQTHLSNIEWQECSNLGKSLKDSFCIKLQYERIFRRNRKG